MAKWKDRDIYIGMIPEGSRKTIVFESTESLDDVITTSTSCGCSRASIEGNTIVVKYTVGKFPAHLKLQGKNVYDTNKKIKVFYRDGSTEVLQFRGTITKI